MTWPSLPLDQWKPTRDTVHLWTQIVGKTRMTLSPPLNHWWNATLYVSAHGLTTSLMPVPDGGAEIEFDFVGHELTITTTSGAVRRMALIPRSVSDFYAEVPRPPGRPGDRCQDHPGAERGSRCDPVCR